MDKSKSRPDTLPGTTTETEAPGVDPEIPFLRGIGLLSPQTVVFRHEKVKYVPVIAQRPSADTRDQGSQADTKACTFASTNTQTDGEPCSTNNKENITQEECHVEEEECRDEEEKGHVDEESRDEIIKIKLREHLIYISHCIKPDDLILHLHCFSDEQKSDILSEKSLIKASRRALEMLLHDVEAPGRFVQLRDAFEENDGYPKIVHILDGVYNPEDQNYVKVVELFTPEIIVRLDPSELLPYLLHKGVFKQMDLEEIRAEERSHGKMRAACVLLMYLPRRTVDWFRCFLQVLIKCNLEDIAEMLDPDIFKDIIQVQTNEQTRGISSIKSSDEPRRAKPKVPPKPMPRKTRTSNTKDHLSPNKESSENVGTNSSEKLDNNLTKCDTTELIYSRNYTTRSPAVDATLEKSDDVVIITEYSDEKIDYLRSNITERKKIDTTMAEHDAEILWPDKERGKNQILLRSISKDKTDATMWSRKKKVWKRNVDVILKTLFAQVAVPEHRRKCPLSSVSKIICRKTTHSEQHISPVRPKQLYSKKQTNDTHGSTDPTKSDTCFSSANIRAAPEKYFMNRNDKAAPEPSTLVLESKSAQSNDQTQCSEGFHESETDVFNSKDLQRYAVSKMKCGRRISDIKGSIVDLKVDVIVNSTDKNLSLTTGLAETIRERGGERIKMACHKYFQTQGSIDEGEAFVSEAGSLTAKYVVHVNGPIKREGTEDEYRLLRQTVMKAMMQASVKNAKTIAVPAISCGISGFSPKIGTKHIVLAVRKFFWEEPSSSLRHVYLVDIYQHIAERFNEALYSEFKDDLECVVERKILT